jgi:hypothetical protein
MNAIKVGTVLDLSDRDYMYGTGRLILRVTKIGDRTHKTDGEWVDLEGFELRSDGSQLGPQPRHAAVRVKGLHGWRGPDVRR